MTRTAMSAWLAAVLAGGAAAAQEAPNEWTVSVGAGAIAAPTYPGSGSLRTIPVPMVEARYGNRLFFSPLGSGVNLVATPRLRFGVSVAPDLGRSADAARAIGQIGPAAEAKLFAAVGAGPIQLLADVRHQLGGADGTLIDGGVLASAPALPGVFVTASAMLTWADARYMRSYFATAGGLALTDTRPFTPGAGPRDASVSLMAFHRFDEHWGAQALARASLLLGDAGASPVTEQRLQPVVGGFVSYKI